MPSTFDIERLEKRIPMAIAVHISGYERAPGVETTFTENVSSRGARVLRTAHARPDDLVDLDRVAGANVIEPLDREPAVEALAGPQDSVQKMITEFDRRRGYIVKRLNAMPGITCPLPKGAFYVFPNITGLFGKNWGNRKISNSSDVTDFILEEAQVAVVAGAAFGDDHSIRFSYATSMSNIEKGMDRMQEALKKLT